jgi:tRNA-Thr(GGU) m(6)t(6)A37 methyltransferase TsaA
VKIEFEPIGTVRTEVEKVPRHWTVSDVEGTIIVDKKFVAGLRDIRAGQRIVVIFHFHKSPAFASHFLVQTPPHINEQKGVFSICSPVRPNAIGMSVLEVVGMEENVIRVKGIDMLDGTPVLDIKPFVEKGRKEGLQ